MQLCCYWLASFQAAKLLQLSGFDTPVNSTKHWPEHYENARRLNSLEAENEANDDNVLEPAGHNLSIRREWICCSTATKG